MSTKFTFTKTMLAAVAIVGAGCLNSASAVSPFDLSYGLQWTYMGGSTANDNPQDMDVTADGKVWVFDSAAGDAWGHGGATGQLRGSIAVFNPDGTLDFTTATPNLPGIVNGANQNVPAGVSTVGNTAYFAFAKRGALHWTGEDGADPERVAVFSIESSGVASIDNRHTLTRFVDNTGTLRTDTLQPNLPGGGIDLLGQNRPTDSVIRDSTLDLIITGDGVGEFATAGDYGGFQINANFSNAFQPQVGVYNFTTNTLTGPAFQPSVGANDGVQNHHAQYFHAEVDQVSGRYYAGGSAHARSTSTSTFWDPDGAGTSAAVIPFANSFSQANAAAIGTAYDASHNLLFGVTWDTSGSDNISTMAASNDGTNATFWAGNTSGAMPGHVNAGGADAYIEKRDASGAVVWSDQLGLSTGTDTINEVTVASNGDVWVSGYFDAVAGDATTRDNFVRVYRETNPNDYSELWTRVVNFGAGLGDGTQELLVDHGFNSREKIYLLSQAFGTFDNLTGATFQGAHDTLVQKLVPGDFNSDGLVDSADITLAEAALAGGPLVGNNTYDFNGDGDSTSADISYWKTNILDMELAALLGDTNNDGTVDTLDIDPFVLLLTNPAGYAAAFPGVDPLAVGDINLDTVVDTLDIDPFVALLTAGSLNGGAVPEPGSIVLLGLAGVAGFALVRRRK